MATQGYANYLKHSFPNEEVKVAIAYDSRNNSHFFAETAAHVFAANGIKVFLFEELSQHRILSIHHPPFEMPGRRGLYCISQPQRIQRLQGLWNDGGQLVPPS
jgi:phosphoglucomutase